MDIYLEKIGGFGRYQKRIFLLLSMPTVVVSMQKLAWVFLAPKVNHRCRMWWEEDNATYPMNDDLMNLLYPEDDQCRYYSNVTLEPPGRNYNKTLSCDGDLVYDTSQYSTSAVIDYGMVCDRSWLRAIVQSVFMVGMLVGSYILGDLSDRVGRKPVFLGSLVVMVVVGIGQVVIPHYAALVVLRFFLGVSLQGIFLVAYVLAMEMVGKNSRAIVGVVAHGFYSIGYFVATLLAWLIPSWRWLQIAMTLSALLFIPYYWFVNSGVYYGLSLSTGNLGGNPYLNFMISGAVEVPALAIATLLLNRIGRRIPLSAFLGLGGLSLLSTMFIPENMNWLLISLAMGGKLCITASYAIIYTLSAEVFPTVVRNVGLGSSSMIARIGGALAPFVNMLSDFWTPLPLLIFGILSFMASLLTLLLPETLGCRLPETLEDGENFGRNHRGGPRPWLDTCQYQEHGQVKLMTFKAKSCGQSETILEQKPVSHGDQTMNAILSVEMPDALMFLINFVKGNTDTPKAGTRQISMRIGFRRAFIFFRLQINK
ncbi:organic cation transporter protein-like isoform X2 [Eriocheir sinensis]|uniref:organic cation transporter protein-like isoform X2 n=1 Tax=Eriocheir sinensis TaxID=95602 RepID=UPI0021C73B96|nr:organic cation transporter protein-like isoform X2 [Eriocheir sinensis]